VYYRDPTTICGKQFVRACKLLLKPYITIDEIDTAHELLKLFNNTFVRIIGPEYCTPNMHMQLHIKSCTIDLGPVYAFWCYSFERYNGVLGAYQTNNRSITMQLMQKFLDNHSIITSYSNLDMDIPSLHELRLVSKENENLNHLIPIYSSRVKKKLEESFLLSNYHEFLSVGRLQCLPQEDVANITAFLQNLLPRHQLTINHLAQSYLRIRIGRDIVTNIFDVTVMLSDEKISNAPHSLKLSSSENTLTKTTME